MSKVVNSESELKKELNNCPRKFVLFYATWCGHSKRFLPIYEKYSKGREDEFCRVIVDGAPECEDKYAIEVVPTVIFFENGRPAKRLDAPSGGDIEEGQFSTLVSSCERPAK